MFGSHGVLKGITNGKCYVEMSTIDEDTIQDIAEVTLVLSLHFNPLHQDNMSVCLIPPYTPLLYSKTGVYRGLHYYLIFALKHILWVLVRATLMRRFLCVPSIYVLSKNMKRVKKNKLKIVNFTAVKTRYMLHGPVF